jgi:hypothetical protein
MKKRRKATAAVLARGRTISAELYQAAIAAVRRFGELVEEDAEPTVNAITTQYRELMTAAEEAAYFELVALHRTSEDVQEFGRLWQQAVLPGPKHPEGVTAIKADVQ